MTPTKFCEEVERRLGWEAPPGLPWKRYQAEARKVARKIATDPELYTPRNLELAIALLEREKKSRTPLGVLQHVHRAVNLAVDEEIDVEVEIRKVVAYETERGDPNGWVVRFARATGAYRAQALAEWREAVQ